MKGTIGKVLMVAALSLTTFAAALPASAGSSYYTFDFKESVKPWMPFAHSGKITDQTLTLKYEVQDNGYAALLAPDADGIGMWTSFAAPPPGNPSPISPNASYAVNVTVAFQAREVWSKGTAQPIVYVGTGKPGSLKDFQKAGPVLGEKWQSYVVETTLKVTKGAQIVIAIGYDCDAAGEGAFDNVIVKMASN